MSPAMDLRALEGVWNRLGRDDPYWAVATWRGKEKGGWSLDDFFATGEEEVSVIFRRFEERGWPPPRGRALDFGCGVGRLSQAIARRMDEVDGVDIAQSMVDLARRHNRYGERCRYHVNAASDLRLFGDGTFDFVYSSIVLQHIPPELSKVYIRELFRVTAPGGWLVFQLTSHRTPVEPPPGVTQTLATQPLAEFRAEIVPAETEIVANAGSEGLLDLTVRNRSLCAWPSLGRDDYRYRIQVGNRWLYEDGEEMRSDDGRATLPHDVPPGGEARLFLPIRLPEENGQYRIEVDLVQEHVAWFRNRGSATAEVRCRVEGGRAAAPRAPIEEPSPFRDRHPRLHRTLVALGLDAVRLRVNQIRHKLTPVPYEPTMVMHSIPRAEVVALLESCGAQVREVDQDLLPDGFQSCRYWVRR
jgi:SAM-dependent methyltransferase